MSSNASCAGNPFRAHLGTVVDDDVMDAVAGEVKQVHQIVHALGVLAGKEKEREAKARGGERFQHLQLLQGLDDERVSLRTAVDDMHRHVAERYAPKQTEQGGLAVILVAEPIGVDLLGMAVGECVVPVIKIRTGPGNAERIEPGGAELSLKAFAQTAFGLGIEMNTSSDVHR